MEKMSTESKMKTVEPNTVETTCHRSGLEEYILSLNEKELKAYLIAKDHLGLSFDLEKSNGFIQWKNRQ